MLSEEDINNDCSAEHCLVSFILRSISREKESCLFYKGLSPLLCLPDKLGLGMAIKVPIRIAVRDLVT